MNLMEISFEKKRRKNILLLPILEWIDRKHGPRSIAVRVLTKNLVTKDLTVLDPGPCYRLVLYVFVRCAQESVDDFILSDYFLLEKSQSN